jgi:hypothetical protein
MAFSVGQPHPGTAHAPRVKPNVPLVKQLPTSGEEVRLTWIGHASWLVQLDRVSLNAPDPMAGSQISSASSCSEWVPGRSRAVLVLAPSPQWRGQRLWRVVGARATALRAGLQHVLAGFARRHAFHSFGSEHLEHGLLSARRLQLACQLCGTPFCNARGLLQPGGAQRSGCLLARRDGDPDPLGLETDRGAVEPQNAVAD